MKTLIFNGSPRKNGDTKSLINEFVKNLKGEYKIVDVYYCNISPCLDCRYCYQHIGCCINDEWQEIDKYIRECDNIVIASPNYFSELSGQLLSVMSRLQSYWCARYFQNEEMIPKKKCGGIILVGGGDGHMSTPIETATGLLHHMNVYNIADTVCFHDTNNKPAIEDANVITGLKELAAFFNYVYNMLTGFDVDVKKIPPQESLEPNPNFPKNELGETYGSGGDASPYEKGPDLIKAIGVNGKTGYIRVKDADGNVPRTPEEALAQQANKEVRVINVYESDGKTIIDKFEIGPGKSSCNDRRHHKGRK